MDAKFKQLQLKQEAYEKEVIFANCESSIIYDDHIIETLIKAMHTVDQTGNMESQQADIMRIFTFKTLCTLLIYLSYNKKIEPCSLKQQHLQMLLKAYQISIGNLKSVMQTPMAEIVPEVLEEEFNNFKMNLMVEGQLDVIDDLMQNPLIILPSISDRQINRKIPPQLLYSRKAIEILSNKIQIFLSLRQVVNLLAGN